MLQSVRISREESAPDEPDTCRFQLTKNVSITQEAVEFIHFLQRNDNEMLECYLKVLGDAVCFLGASAGEITEQEEKEKVVDLLSEMSVLRKSLERLKLPE